MELRIARPRRNWRIQFEDLSKLIDSRTKLVAVSCVSMINGFQHDLKSLCGLANSRGALVFVDTVQAVGAVPVDVKASGVDFLACSSYKWLMGDMGLGSPSSMTSTSAVSRAPNMASGNWLTCSITRSPTTRPARP